MNVKKIRNWVVATAAVIGLGLAIQSFAAPEQAIAPSTSSTNTKKFVKTSNRCSKCSCSGYWGYKHLNGHYEGNCSNRDKYGYTCGHGPEKHGLKKW